MFIIIFIYFSTFSWLICAVHLVFTLNFSIVNTLARHKHLLLTRERQHVPSSSCIIIFGCKLFIYIFCISFQIRRAFLSQIYHPLVRFSDFCTSIKSFCAFILNDYSEIQFINRLNRIHYAKNIKRIFNISKETSFKCAGWTKMRCCKMSTTFIKWKSEIETYFYNASTSTATTTQFNGLVGIECEKNTMNCITYICSLMAGVCCGNVDLFTFTWLRKQNCAPAIYCQFAFGRRKQSTFHIRDEIYTLYIYIQYTLWQQWWGAVCGVDDLEF